MNGAAASQPLHVFLVAGEESGDRLGGPLMRALKERHGNVTFSAGLNAKPLSGA